MIAAAAQPRGAAAAEAELVLVVGVSAAAAAAAAVDDRAHFDGGAEGDLVVEGAAVRAGLRRVRLLGRGVLGVVALAVGRAAVLFEGPQERPDAGDGAGHDREVELELAGDDRVDAVEGAVGGVGEAADEFEANGAGDDDAVGSVVS